MKQIFIENILFIERLHRRFLDVIKAELDKLGVDDINNVQTLILYNVNQDRMTISELTSRGYYLGSNVSYNIKKLVEAEYLIQERSLHDKRAVKIRLSEKGLLLCTKIDTFLEKSLVRLKEGGIQDQQLGETSKKLRKIERFLSELLDDIY
jgi:DNA-binding MarR family transcriptional regulator